jgi:hypothetical protein
VDCRLSFSAAALAAAIGKAAALAGGDLQAAVAVAAAPVVSADPFEAMLAPASQAGDNLEQVIAALGSVDSPPVLVLDNVAHLSAWEKSDLASLAGALASHTARVVMIGPAGTQQLLAGAGLSVHGTINLDDLPRPGEGEVAAGIVGAAAKSGVSFDGAAAQAVARLAKCHLRSCQQLADAAWQAANELGQDEVDIACVRAAYTQLMQSEHMDFAAVFMQLLSGSSQDQRLARILCLVADNAGSRLRSDDLAARYAIGASGRMAIQRDLKRLAQQGLVVQDGHVWHLADPILEAWLRTRSPWI